jgi:hypothetical protein
MFFPRSISRFTFYIHFWPIYWFSLVTYLGVTCDRMTWRHHIERTVAKVLLTYTVPYSLFKSGRLGTNIKLSLYNALLGLVRFYACLTWKYAADTHLLKLQRLHNRVLRATGNLDRWTPVFELHVAFKIPLCTTTWLNYASHWQS